MGIRLLSTLFFSYHSCHCCREQIIYSSFVNDHQNCGKGGGWAENRPKIERKGLKNFILNTLPYSQSFW